MQTKLAGDVAKGFKRLSPSEAKAFALAVPTDFYSAVAGLSALFPDDRADPHLARTLSTERTKKAAPSIPTKRTHMMKKAAPTKKAAPSIPTKRIPTMKMATKKAASAKKTSRR